jgi:signal peptidase I
MRCTNCGRELRDDAKFCDFCATPNDAGGKLAAGSREGDPQARSGIPQPWLALLLSLFIPGFGQIYNGQILRAFVFSIGLDLACFGAVVAGFPSTFLGIIALVSFSLAVYLGIAADAYLNARERSSNRIQVKRSSVVLYGAFAAALYLLGVFGMTVGQSYFYQAYKIPSGAMEPTLLVGDDIMVDKGNRTAHRGDVIVFEFPPDPAKDFVKRVTGVAGDTVAVKDGRLWVNGRPTGDPHARFELPDKERSPISPRDNFGPITVPPGHVFVLGDNRDRSYDSRYWGFVGNTAIKGRVLYIYWSWTSGAPQSLFPVRWSRIGRPVE